MTQHHHKTAPLDGQIHSVQGGVGLFPLLIGTPVYDWSRMELSRIFGITVCPTRETAGRIWDRTAEMLASPEFSSRAILSRFGIEYQSPVASLFDDLAPYRAAGVAPSLRGDDLLDPTPERRAALPEVTSRQRLPRAARRDAFSPTQFAPATRRLGI